MCDTWHLLWEGAAKAKPQTKAKGSGPLGLALAGKTMTEKIQLARSALSFCFVQLVTMAVVPYYAVSHEAPN